MDNIIESVPCETLKVGDRIYDKSDVEYTITFIEPPTDTGTMAVWVDAPLLASPYRKVHTLIVGRLVRRLAV